MRWLWMLPVITSACAPPLPQVAIYHSHNRGYSLKTPDSENCGTPDEYKPCMPAIWAPPPRIPVYAVQLEDIPGNISISDMPAIPGGISVGDTARAPTEP